MVEPDGITGQKNIANTTIIELAKVEEEITTSKKNVLFWAFYDAADTVFAMAIISITLYQWGELVGMKQGYSFDQAHIMISTFLMISNIIVAILLPILGAHSDIMGKRKLTVLIFGGATILLIPLIALSSRFLLGLTFLLVANVCYQAGNLYYESMLPYICSTESRAKVSAFGVAFGYVGTIFSILLIFILPIIFGNATKADDVINHIVAPEDIQLNFVFWMFFFAALFYFLLLIPFLWVKEKYNESKEKLAISRQIKSTFIQLGRTIKEIFTENKGMLLFLLGWFLVNDSVGTCIAILVDYLREGVGFGETRSGIVLFIGIIVGIGFLYVMGPIIDKRGPRFGIIITTSAWAVGIVLAVLAGVTYKTTFDPEIGIIEHKLKILAYFASIVLSFGMGAIWVIARQYILELAPPKKIGQYMGIKKISGKASAAFGPLIFSLILSASLPLGKTLAYQIAIISLLGTFFLGFIILLFIKNNHQRYLKGERFPYGKEEKALE